MTDIYDMSDEELEAAFREAKAEGNSPVTEYESNEEEDNSLEQPEEQDSDDDTETDELDDVEFDEDSTDTEEEPEGEAEEDVVEEPESKETEAKEAVQPAQDEVLTFKANGQEYKFTTAEVKEQFGKVFGQAMNYTKKMQHIKPWTKTIDALEQAELGQDDVNLMIDVLKGDKDAIATVLKRTGVDALDLDTENSKYVAKDYGRNDTELSIRDIVDEISVDKEYAITYNVLEKQWDDKSRRAFVEDPSKIRALHIDVKSGMFDKLSPIAQKLKVYGGGAKSDLDYYMDAAQQYFASQAEYDARARAQETKAVELTKLNEVKARQDKQVVTKEAAVKRKAAATTRKVAGTKKASDYLDDSDEDFDEWYNKLQGSL